MAELRDLDATGLQSLRQAYRPAVLRGLVSQWPAVQAALSPAGVASYLKRFDTGRPAELFVGPPGIEGRYFYSEDMAGFNFERRGERIGAILDRLAEPAGQEPVPSVYMGAVPIAEHLPGFQAENRLELLDPQIGPRLWIGSASIVAPHYDLSDNIACVVAGRRRFTLFPPDQVSNLYVGPIDHTIAGQPASMVSVRNPDFARHPRFAQALEAAETADLEPGDAIYIPSLWWHGVQSFDRLNVLVNSWWDDQPADAGSPFEALVHGILAVSALPAPRRAAWRAMFDHYVFQTGDDPAAHLAPQHRGVLGVSTPALRARIKEFLMRGLARR